MSERSDVDLLRAHVDGDPRAFAELFHRHRDRLWAVALRTCADRDEAADALQDALLSAHRAAARFRGDSALTTWLYRIVVNACLDRIRRHRSHPTVPLPDGHRGDGYGDGGTGGVEPTAPVVDHDTVITVRQALGQLPTDQRTAIVLVDLQGYSVAEASKILDVAEGTVKSRCSRGRGRLASLLGHLKAQGPENQGSEHQGSEHQGSANQGSEQLPEQPAGNHEPERAVPSKSGSPVAEGGAS